MGRKKFVTVALAYMLLLGGLTGCSLDRWEEVAAGEYVVAAGEGLASQVGKGVIQMVAVDRQNRQAVLYMVGGSKKTIAFISRKKADWPSGCPTNIHMTHMEVLDLEAATLIIGSNTFTNPILVRDCPRNPERVVLRSDGEMGGSGTACTYMGKCVYFMRR